MNANTSRSGAALSFTYGRKKKRTRLNSNPRLQGTYISKKITVIVYSRGLVMGLRIFYHPLRHPV
jgi:hypothetical protein